MMKKSMLFKGFLSKILPATLLLSSLGTLTTPALASFSDPGVVGSHGFSRVEYNLGDTAFQPTNFPTARSPSPVELRASVHYPADLTGGPYPVVVFLHGRHSTCYNSSTRSMSLAWPCKGSSTLPSFKGYDYVSQVMASQGFIVVSISANGINAKDNSNSAYGMDARAELTQKHLELLQQFNKNTGTLVGLLPVSLQGKFDFNQVGTMGHSRGGEGVVKHFLLNQSAVGDKKVSVKALLPLAPTDFFNPVANNVPLSVMLPYCDGDVSDLQGIKYYNQSRYALTTDTAAKHSILVMGANHNYFNSIWSPSTSFGGGDDWSASSNIFCGTATGNKRLTEAQQRGVGLAYMTAFFRTYVKGESEFSPYLTGAAEPPVSANLPTAPSSSLNHIYVSYHPDVNKRMDINKGTSLLSLAVSGTALSQFINPYELCGANNTGSSCPYSSVRSQLPEQGVSQLHMGWFDNSLQSSWVNNFNTAQDVSGFSNLQFRAGVNFTDSLNTSCQPANFKVRIKDQTNQVSPWVSVGDYSKALYYPPGKSSCATQSTAAVPKIMLNTVRLPLVQFPGVNLREVKSVEFQFGNGADATSRRIVLNDLMFAS